MRNKSLWSAKDVAKAIHAKSHGVWWADNVAIDSRTLKAGALYFAIQGERVDGHAFVKDALDKGAVAAVVNRAIDSIPPERLLIVDDTMKALTALGIASRTRSKARVIGVTGSIGKTTTKEMLALMCAAFGKTHATFGNLNNHIGVPLTLANMPKDTEYAVIEMGMNHEGEIAYLTKMARPHVALITTIEAVHLEHFESVDGIADAKAEIFIGLMPHGVAVLNRDNGYFDYLYKHANRFHPSAILCFGRHQDADIRLVDVKPQGDGVSIDVVSISESFSYSLNASGDGPVLASLAALTVAHSLGRDLMKAAKALGSFTEVEGRGRVQEILFNSRSMWWIDDSYNAGPASMAAAFNKLADVAGRTEGVKRSVAVLGDMLELGEQAPEFHRELAAKLVAAGIQKVYAAGALMQHMMDALPESMRGGHVLYASELADILNNDLRTGDAVLFKGSHGSKIYQLVETLQTQNTRK